MLITVKFKFFCYCYVEWLLFNATNSQITQVTVFVTLFVPVGTRLSTYCNNTAFHSSL